MSRPRQVAAPPAERAGGAYWNTEMVISWLGISRATLERRLRDGTVPKPVKIGGLRRWNAAELERFEQRLLADRVAP